MRWCEIEKLRETSTAGSTSSSNVAILPGNKKTSRDTIGAGFDASGDYGVYPKPHKMLSGKPSLIRR